MPDPSDEDADVRAHLPAFGPAALAELRRVLEAPTSYRTRSYSCSRRGVLGGPRDADRDGRHDEIVRLRLLRAIRDLSA